MENRRVLAFAVYQVILKISALEQIIIGSHFRGSEILAELCWSGSSMLGLSPHVVIHAQDG